MLEKICNYFIYLYFSVNYLARDYNLLKTVIDDNIEDLEKYLEYNANINNIIRFFIRI